MSRALKSFEYFEPRIVEEAVRILFMYGREAKVLAGGVDLVPKMRKRQIQPKCLVSIQRIPGMDYIESDGAEGLRIGALTSLRSIELSPAIQKDYELLHEAIHQIASIQVKNMGTAVGNLCVATPASDVALPLLVLGAKLRIVGLTQERTVPIEKFFIGVGQTVLQPSEIVTEVLLPSPPAATGGAFLKIMRTATDVAKVNVAVTVIVTDGICQDVKIALGSVAPTPIRANKAEEALKGKKLDQETIAEAAETAAEETKPIDDIRSTAEYRKEVTKVLVRRAIKKALERVKA